MCDYCSHDARFRSQARRGGTWHARAVRRLLTSLEPRWFTTVMGTAVVAVAGAKLGLPGVRVVSWVALVLAAALLVALLVGSAGHWLAAARC